MEASTMDIVVISATEKQRIKSELESFLGNTYVKLNKLLVCSKLQLSSVTC